MFSLPQHDRKEQGNDELYFSNFQIEKKKKEMARRL